MRRSSLLVAVATAALLVACSKTTTRSSGASGSSAGPAPSSSSTAGPSFCDAVPADAVARIAGVRDVRSDSNVSGQTSDGRKLLGCTYKFASSEDPQALGVLVIRYVSGGKLTDAYFSDASSGQPLGVPNATAIGVDLPGPETAVPLLFVEVPQGAAVFDFRDVFKTAVPNAPRGPVDPGSKGAIYEQFAAELAAHGDILAQLS